MCMEHDETTTNFVAFGCRIAIEHLEHSFDRQVDRAWTPPKAKSQPGDCGCSTGRNSTPGHEWESGDSQGQEILNWDLFETSPIGKPDPQNN